jgi:UDP-glucose 4-epimerase
VVRISYDQVYNAGFEDIPRRVPDIRKLSSLIGWTPTHDLDSILRTMVDHATTAGGTDASANE